VHKIRDKEILEQFGANLKDVRKEKGITQEELAFQSGLALSQIARIETGRLNTSICTLVVLARTLEVDPGELLKSL
jgi:transcriptional regulator with XRE-family HTH domain